MPANFKELYETKGGKHIITTLRYNQDLLSEAINRTSFAHSNTTISERIFLLIHNYESQPLCNHCIRPLKFHKLNKGYYSSCGEYECMIKQRSVINIESSKKIDWKDSLSKQKKSMLIKYGAEHNWQSESTVRHKCHDTMEKKYGVRHALQDKDFLETKQKTVFERFGTLNFIQSEKTRNTILERYGIDIWVDNIMSSSIIKDSIVLTCIEKYGVSNPMQNQEVFNRAQKTGFKAISINGLICRGSYEKDFVEKYLPNHIIENGPTIKFMFNKNEKIYFPDFYLPTYNLIIEIKSAYYMKKYLELNEAKAQAAIEQGFNFMFIVNKDYDEFDKYLGTDIKKERPKSLF